MRPERDTFADKLVSRSASAFLLPQLPGLLNLQGERPVFFVVLAAYVAATIFVAYGVRAVLGGALDGTAFAAWRYAKHLVVLGAACQTLIGACLLYGHWTVVLGGAKPSILAIGVLLALLVTYAGVAGWATYVVQRGTSAG